ncbi:hypothetical protein ABDB91_12150 [Desulfoscipio sp. XC116]|uniref:hypothetical protein n=1 Tax=Desulfoscipio sp. XC116 TaxID=3144975 RepID=UPI00325B5365
MKKAADGNKYYYLYNGRREEIPAKKVDKAALRLNLSPIYGLENAYGYGRVLAVWLIEKAERRERHKSILSL